MVEKFLSLIKMQNFSTIEKMCAFVRCTQRLKMNDLVFNRDFLVNHHHFEIHHTGRSLSHSMKVALKIARTWEIFRPGNIVWNAQRYLYYAIHLFKTVMVDIKIHTVFLRNSKILDMNFFRFMILTLFSVQADLIAWNRSRNTTIKRIFRRASPSISLIDQYQHFYNAKCKNAIFIKTRRFSKTFATSRLNRFFSQQ